MQGDINREVFPTFLANKSYDWWITRRRMEIYTKISKRKDLVWSRQKQGKIRTTQGGVRILEDVRNFRTSLEQLSSEGRIFLISAPTRTWFEALDSWLPELWNGIYHVENRLRKVLKKCQRILQLLSSVFLFASFCFSLLFSFCWLALV